MIDIKGIIFPNSYICLRLVTIRIMKVLLDIKNNKADFVMELLQSLSFVKAEPISTSKARF